MSKAVRIRDHLYAEIEKLAKQERRSLISQLEVLLEQALKIESSGATTPSLPEAVTSEPAPKGRVAAESRRLAPPYRAAPEDPDVKTDFK